MSATERQLAQDRARREVALAAFNDRLDGIRDDLAARGVGARVADTVKDSTVDALDAGLDVARERKGLIAGTFGALLLWLFRAPLLTAAAALIARARGNDETDDNETSSDEPDIEDETRDQSE